MAHRATYKELRTVFKKLDAEERGRVLDLAEALAGDGTAKGHKQEANPGVYGVDEARGAEAPEENVPSYTDAAVDDPLR